MCSSSNKYCPCTARDNASTQTCAERSAHWCGRRGHGRSVALSQLAWHTSLCLLMAPGCRMLRCSSNPKRRNTTARRCPAEEPARPGCGQSGTQRALAKSEGTRARCRPHRPTTLSFVVAPWSLLEHHRLEQPQAADRWLRLQHSIPMTQFGTTRSNDAQPVVVLVYDSQPCWAGGASSCDQGTTTRVVPTFR